MIFWIVLNKIIILKLILPVFKNSRILNNAYVAHIIFHLDSHSRRKKYKTPDQPYFNQ